jgi:hypothetical protein
LNVSKPVLYLATPYSHPSPAVRKERFEQVTQAAARLVSLGHVVHSPITLTHPIEQVLLSQGGAPPSTAFWLAFDRPFMSMCDELVVLTLEGWEQSHGVAHEVLAFKTMGRPITYVIPGHEATRYTEFGWRCEQRKTKRA